MYGQGQLAEGNFFFKMLGLRFKNIQIWPMANSKIVINRRLDPCLVKYGHQEILEILIRHYEPPKCIVDGRLRYELVTIL